MCSEALCIAENIIHPRLPVVGVEALSRYMASSRSQADEDIADTEPVLFGSQFDLRHTNDQSAVEPSEDSVADTEVHGLSVSESYPSPALPFTVPLPAMESHHTEEPLELPADDVVYSPNERTMMEVSESAAVRNIVDSQSDVTSPATGQELETSDLVLSLTAASSFAVTPNSLSASTSTVQNTVRENSTNNGLCDTLTTASAPAVSQCSGSDIMNDQLPECSQSGLSQLSLRKRKHSTASSVNDGEDSESEAGEIEV